MTEIGNTEYWAQVELKELKGSVKRKEDGAIIIDGHYGIGADRIDTPQKVLGWIIHLTEKNWITTQHIHEIIRNHELTRLKNVDRGA